MPLRYEDPCLVENSEVSILDYACIGDYVQTEVSLNYTIEGYLHVTEDIPRLGRIIVVSPQKLGYGTHKLSLQPFPIDEAHRIIMMRTSGEAAQKLCRILQVRRLEGETFQGALCRWLSEENEGGSNRIFQIRSRIAKEQMEKILEEWDWAAILNDFFYENVENKDPDMIAVLYPDLIPAPHNVAPKNIEKYIGHKIILKQTKLGVSYLAAKIAGIRHLYVVLTSSRLLGFSTANESHLGDLAGYDGPIYSDDARIEEGLIDHLMTLMEQGEASIGTGSKTLSISSRFSFTHISNIPEIGTTPLHFLEQITKLFKNAEGAGSRIGIVLVKPQGIQIDEAILRKNGPGSIENIQKNEMIIREAIEQCRPQIEELWREPALYKWLNQKETYHKEIQEVLTKSALQDPIRVFWVAHVNGGYRHLRGAALNAAILENLPRVYFGTISLEELLEEAEIWVQKYLHINQNSIQLFADLHLPEAEFYHSLLMRSPKYIRAIVYGTALKMKEEEKLAEPMLDLETTLTPYLSDFPDEIKAYVGGFTTWSVLERVIKNLETTNRHLNPFRMRLVELEGRYWLILRPDTEELLHKLLAPVAPVAQVGAEAPSTKTTSTKRLDEY